jgi:hypothetical protein
MVEDSLPATPNRVVHHADALEWLRERGRLHGASVVTSLPDISEVPHLGFDGWKQWFESAARLTMDCVPDEGVAIFFQSDIRHAGLWVDKGFLVSKAAQLAGMVTLFHRIVCYEPPGTETFGRATYAHFLGFARVWNPSRSLPAAHVIPNAGPKSSTKSMGVNICLDACRFVASQTSTRTIVDPFCGFGTVLAAANACGLDAIGVDLSVRMCRRARALQIELPTNGVS